MINQINSNKWNNNTKPINSIKNSKVEKVTPVASSEQSAKTDKVEVGTTKEDSVTYSKIGKSKKNDASEVASLVEQANIATENLRKLVEQLILKQSKGYKESIEGFTETAWGEKISVEDIDQAALSISEDGEWGVKAVSDRLVDFAISVSGGDKTKFAELKSAIDEGFAAAKKALGGTLPDICNETYNETMRKLDAWAKEN